MNWKSVFLYISGTLVCIVKVRFYWFSFHSLAFYSQVEAKKAVPRDDQNILNRNNSSIQGSPGPARTKKIFVGGLASTVTESDFKKYFDQFGTITDVVVMYDQNTQRPRGFGFITFDSEEAVENVLYKTFHELNGKLVEVKRAVPKELSPGPSRGQLGGHNYGLSRVSLLNGYNQGYNPSSVGGYGLRLDGRFSPVTIGRSGLPPFSPGYGTGPNIEPGLSPNYGGNANLSSNLGFGQGSNPLYSGNSNRNLNPIGYGGGNGGNSSMLSSSSRTLWGNGSLNYATNATNPSALLGSGSGNSRIGSFDNIGALWSSSLNSGIGGGAGSTYGGGNLSYGSGEINFGSGGVGYGRNSGTSVAPASSALKGSYNGASEEIYEGLFYGEPTWQSSFSDVEGSGSFGYGFGNAASDALSKNSGGYVGGYSVNNRQSNRGEILFPLNIILIPSPPQC